MTTTASARVAVIGAGWAGLAAAVELTGRGIPVTVHEASRNLGGRARRVMVEDVGLDNGQHILIGAYSETLALMRRVGADPDKLLLRLPLQLRYASGFSLSAPGLPAPLHLLAALLGAKGLSLAQRFSAIGFMRSLTRAGFHIEPDIPVAALLEKHGQTGALREFLWEPLCVSALNTPIAIASAQVFATVLRDSLTGVRANSDLLLPRADLGTLLPEPALEYLEAHGGEVVLGVAVHAIRQQAGTFRLDDRAEDYSQVILAVGPQHAAALMQNLPALAPVRETIEAFDYQPITTCYLKYPDGITLPCPMLGFSGGIIQWAFDRGALSNIPGLIAAVVSASGEHQELSQDAFSGKVHAELRQALGTLPRPLWTRVIAEKRATFSCRPGLARPQNRTAVPGLLLAGDYTDSPYPATLEAAVRSGFACARMVAEPA